MKSLYKTLVLLPLMVVSCTDLITYEQMGTQPTPPSQVTPVLSLHAANVPNNSINILFTKGKGITQITNDIYICSTRPLQNSITIDLDSGGQELVDEYSKKIGTDYLLLPQSFFKFSYGNYIDVQSESTTSDFNKLTIYSVNRLGNSLAPGRYLLPIVASCPTEIISNNVIYIDIHVRKQWTDPDGFELYRGKDMFTICYLNTNQFDPRLANDMILNIFDANFNQSQRALCNILNLRSASVGYDARLNKVSVSLDNDLRYVLDHYSEMILPVQESGRKVCLCIEGGGKGLGFCNFTDNQIEEFVKSVKRIIYIYGLDGINLWDRNSGYDKSEESGFQKMNTTSYPKLIKRLRESLGDNKLLTITDYEEPTEYFYDTSKTGGIEVGRYIDYAWHGYYDNAEPLQVVDPWNQELEYVSKNHPRKPIAGLERERYGCLHGTLRKKWENQSGVKWLEDSHSNGLYVFFGIRSNIQDQYEGCTQNIMGFMHDLLGADYGTYADRVNNMDSHDGNLYNKWIKHW